MDTADLSGYCYDRTGLIEMTHPDPILAELWEVKRPINAEAGYRLEERTRMARASAEKIRHQWQREGLSATRQEQKRPATYEK